MAVCGKKRGHPQFCLDCISEWKTKDSKVSETRVDPTRLPHDPIDPKVVKLKGHALLPFA